MLTDMIEVEEFEIKEEEPWYDNQDLEHDLHLAAELGKTLLDRNSELEQGLQQMYSTNQEQLQEIEYLTKQMDLLRQVNDQHAKVYEQLDQSSRELEQSNTRLVQDNRAAQHKIQGLTEMIEALQTQMEDLQCQVENLKTAPANPHRQPLTESYRPYGAQSVSCLNDLQPTHRYSSYDSGDQSDDRWSPSDLSWREEEQESLRRSLRSLQTQLVNERARREGAERDADLLANENVALEQRLGMMEGCQERGIGEDGESEGDVMDVSYLSKLKGCDVLKRCNSEKQLRSPWDEGSEVDESHDHERSCIRRSEVVKQRGISLLNEVDAQYSALQVKYDALLRLCHQGQPDPSQQHNHKEVQTPSGAPSDCPQSPAPASLRKAAGTDMKGQEDELHQPDYKALFKEIFTCIQKTKEDLSENRGKPWQLE
ncbi:unnamed protein product [Coregonus sp. 'balchen']|nr:unnamed protein product [Coregonus sp. 'balchen']